MYGVQNKDLRVPSVASLVQQNSPRRVKAFALTVLIIFSLSIVWAFGVLDPPAYNARWHHGLADGERVEWWTASKANSNAIPPKIWQIFLPKNQTQDQDAERAKIDPDKLEDTASWLALNPDYTYTLIGDKGGNEFVTQHFAQQPALVDVYRRMPNVGMKSDLLRYLVLGTQGGVYTDTDTRAIRPVDEWIPAQFRGKVRLIVGLEFDRRDGPGWADILHWVQFCQWTIVAAPGHPVFAKMANHVLTAMDALSHKYGLPIDQIHPESSEVMNSTGPAAWTEVVFQQLQEYDPTLKSTKDLSFMTEPRLIGDVLVLTIDGFGMGQQHSMSTNNGSIPEAALMAHDFRGSWRGQ